MTKALRKLNWNARDGDVTKVGGEDTGVIRDSHWARRVHGLQLRPERARFAHCAEDVTSLRLLGSESLSTRARTEFQQLTGVLALYRATLTFISSCEGRQTIAVDDYPLPNV